ncbi:MAG TPA: nickel-responsive transcriptional regulator NikR [Bacteroidia bacterium]|nr:nickel-responsive transcriptional regulator NikR [Sphingobacteriales bacterium]HPD64288.1 nickel-responsive transcriptional regulator NikR [Bacteroidia bacterium]HRS58029.1 nickel-responsive transcriptional regulator NikR [Bacteroidia bacterium]HRU68854.1 nickel-responsive transcriptional regulator NikR [Bacteroidia bacterium]
MQVKRFGVSLEEDLLKKLDNLVKDLKFPNRSQAIRYLIQKQIVDKKWDSDEEVAGAIVLVYDHHKRDLQNQSTSLQHDFHDIILAVQHVHLNHDNCLETITLKGKASQLKELADRLIAIKGIKHGELVITNPE